MAPNAADEPLVKLSGAYGKAGEEVTLAVTLENNPGIPAFYLSLPYDTNHLTYVSAAAGDIVEANFTAFDFGDKVVISALSLDGGDVKSGSVLFTVMFRINEGVTENVSLEPFYTYGGIESAEKLHAWEISPGDVAGAPTAPGKQISVTLQK
jgi:hypothetical protein